MANLMARGMDFLIRNLEQAAAVTGGVTYTRGAESVSLSAWVGRTVYRQNVQEGAAVIFGERDYLFEAATLILGGNATVPRQGDRITETINGQVMTFEVMDPSTVDEPVWRYSDQLRQVIRVHVKRVVTPT